MIDVGFTAVRTILLPFGKFCGPFGIFFPFSREKSGNPVDDEPWHRNAELSYQERILAKK
jgi:hypothetical protein